MSQSEDNQQFLFAVGFAVGFRSELCTSDSELFFPFFNSRESLKTNLSNKQKTNKKPEKQRKGKRLSLGKWVWRESLALLLLLTMVTMNNSDGDDDDDDVVLVVDFKKHL